jgi:CHAD domain-containing protein
MTAGKWIEGLSGSAAPADAARRVLAVRLEMVREYLPLAAHEPEKDPEHVHQLRVGTRRARAALDIFAGCLPAKVYKAARKQLRDVRRAAGQARDWDVFLADLTRREHRPSRRHRAGLDVVVGYALARRSVAQAHLEEVVGGDPFAFDRCLAETLAAVQPPDDPDLRTLSDLARPTLTRLLAELEEAAAGDLDDYAHLHQVRIAGKRLRYAMEVFASCFTRPFRDVLYPAVEEMQEILGAANDSHVATGHLETLRDRLHAILPQEWKRLRPGIDGLLRYHRERLPRERERFRAWWQRWRRSGGEAAVLALLKPGKESARRASPRSDPGRRNGRLGARHG